MDFKTIGIVMLVFALAAVGYWGYNQYGAMQNVQKDLESELNNRYENAFQGLNHHIDALESELGTVMVAQAADNLSVNLSNIWRSAYSAQEDIGQLPLSDSSLDNTKSMLHRILQYTNHLDKKVVDGGLSDKDKKMLNSFYKNVMVANKNLEGIHDKMLQKNFKWYDKKRVKMDSDADQQYSASPLAGLVELDKSLKLDEIQKELEAIFPDGGIELNDRDITLALTEVQGKTVNQKQAIQTAKRFINNPEQYKYNIIDKEQLKVNGRTIETHLPAHSIQATNKNNKNEKVYIDVSKKGGQVISLLNSRATKGKKITEEQAEAKAAEFLKKNGYEHMEVVSSKPFNDIAMIVLAPVQKAGQYGVIITPDSVSTEVAMDNGEVIGFNGIEYLLHHKDRPESMLIPKFSMEEAKKKISSNLNITHERLVIDTHGGGKEVLCYEFIGEIGDGQGDANYRVHINAITGKEEVVHGVDDDFYKNVK
ncbi:spore germination protein [Orenia metallireducens]|uniref:Spore germination protein n=1 Tax=Orenia metallireducens TaxID=1413210 RepID=A0A285GU41_9FIRM|nr:PepSY1/2 domain-containing protein [Orenia metallireducens]PRX25263.1 spore germination protein [Orenia metallireducens]SNY27037.1 spore germination protein [Orenia metallireducens]